MKGGFTKWWIFRMVLGVNDRGCLILGNIRHNYALTFFPMVSLTLFLFLLLYIYCLNMLPSLCVRSLLCSI